MAPQFSSLDKKIQDESKKSRLIKDQNAKDEGNK
jgi:hypothetical protein